MCWICKLNNSTGHSGLDKFIKQYFEPKKQYLNELAEAGYYEKVRD